MVTTVVYVPEGVTILVSRVFTQDDHAGKYAVEPLLDGDGTLGDLSVRLKLIYGLRVLRSPEKDAAELLMSLADGLSHDGTDSAFAAD